MQWTLPKFGGPWPSPAQELLLQAALGGEASAREALARWEPGFDPERVDHETLTLLPLLSKNLETHRIGSPFADKYRSVYRWSWYRNQLLFDGTRQVLARLHGAGIATILLKGAALSRLAYADDGVRPMGDADLLVPSGDVHAAARALEALGYLPVLPLGPGLIRSRHSASFRDRLGREIDLHWHVLTEDIGPGADDDFWEASRPIEWRGAPTRVLCPADHVLLLGAHGALGGMNTSPIYWIADVTVLLRRSGEAMDWGRLQRQARDRRLTLTMRRGLEYVAQRFEAPVPHAARAALGGDPVPAAERVEYALKMRSAARSPLGNLPRYWFTYWRRCRRLGRRPGAIGFLRFVKDNRLVDTPAFLGRALLWPARQLVWLVIALLRSVSGGSRHGPQPVTGGVRPGLRRGRR